MPSALKRLFVGTPLASDEEQHQRLIKIIALAVFASDAISSTAYASEEILLVLAEHSGMKSLDYLLPISFVVAALLAIVVFSYRQTLFAYPSGGGAYVVSRENLGVTPSLVAGSSLLVDYILTVAVSVSAGVAAITSAVPEWQPYRVEICLGFVALLTVANLRGVKESGRVFAVPTYAYVVALYALIFVGLGRSLFGGLDRMPVNEEAIAEITNNGASLQAIGLFLLMRAFSSGAVALSGVEAISNGITAFKKPESRNGSVTLAWMAIILGTSFIGVSWLAHRLGPTPIEPGTDGYETLLSQMGAYVFGRGTVIYWFVQIATFAILILAANTAYADFPRLSSIIARDGFLPRQLSNRGDRLVFSNGILVLAGAAGVLIVAFRGQTNALIPLYAVGVFTGFTLSQAGMVVHHFKLKEPHWQLGAAINGVGSLATGVVLSVVVISKFTIGAWIPTILIPLIVLGLRRVHGHYVKVAKALSVPDGYRASRHTHTCIVLVGRVHRGVLHAVSYARSLQPERLIAVSVVYDKDEHDKVVQAWDKFEIPIELRTIYSPYRDLSGPIMQFIDELDARHPDDVITVIVPEFVLHHWWEGIFHNQSAYLLKSLLRQRPNTIVTAVPIQISGATSDDV